MWLNTEVNKTDCYRYSLTGRDGKTEFGMMSYDCQVYAKEKAALSAKGKLILPFKKVIEVRSQTTGEILMILTAGLMTRLWRDLHAYLHPDYKRPIPVPPVFDSGKHDYYWDNIILLPDSLARHFNQKDFAPGIDSLTYDGIPRSHFNDSYLSEQRDESVDFLKNEKEIPHMNRFVESANSHAINNMESHESDCPPHISPRLSLNQIALKYAWEGIAITKQNRDEIARKFGHNCGNKLQQNYFKVMRKSGRVADPDGSAKIMQNKIDLFESVIEIISPAFRDKAIEEVNILKAILERTYLNKAL